ncbi:MAG TPA: 7-carboxy-7-deazaguanine synthase QueE [Elusimicrobiales bacterium]|nr:7-carboxy-7-deazaguanine synthase QueE [Elusimicrobiales bacterium]HOL62625.1 7-carboxy-7-deazaguanine synthase QueE [Elusimicrobiales bacterium]HPO94568.1 7-carboxy-7-deazaguanine synthase QueE [Elusimicrobiales bacterium]
MKDLTAPIYEIFVSYQGEGLFVGQRQIFVRFSGCNLKCSYCDEQAAREKSDLKSLDWAVKKIKELSQKYKTNKISFTGGEPLLYHYFIKNLIKKLGKKYFYVLETNGTLYKNLDGIISLIDFVSMDIKLSDYVKKDLLKEHMSFFKKCKRKSYIKMVFDKKIKISELEKIFIEISKIKKDVVFFLQPATINRKIKIDKQLSDEIYKIASDYLKDVRLLPQIHKLIKIK